MRVAMTLPDFEVGGMERFQLSLSQALTARGLTVRVYGLRGDGPLRAAFAGCTDGAEVLTPARPGPAGLWWPAPLVRALSGFRPDVVHAVSGVWLASSRAAQLTRGAAMVQAQHGLEPRRGHRERLVLRLAARRSHAVVAVSDEVARQTTELSQLTEPPIVIANGIPLPALRPGVAHAARAAWGLPARAFVLGCLARFDPVKNLPLLLHALAGLREARPELDAHLLLAGDGAARGELVQLAQSLGVSAQVIMPGMVADPTRVLEVLDVCVLTSTTEGTPLSLIEAMAAGVPVVASAVGGIPSLLGDGAAGVLVPPNDRAAFVAALASVVDEPSETAARARAARRLVERSFAIEAVAARYVAVYEAAMRRAGVATHGP